MQNRKTREVRILYYDYEWFKDESSDESLWSCGNFSCDCNRGQEFERAVGIANSDFPCNIGKNDSNFDVLGIYLVDGTFVYSDFPDNRY